MQITRFVNYRGALRLVLALFLCGRLFAGVTASISGTVKDASGAVIAGAKVTATNTETGIVSTQSTNTDGYYSFQSLALGHYNIEVQQTGFKLYRQTGVVLDVNAARVVDVSLQVGQVNEKVEVASEALHIETSSTQMGEVIEGSRMTAVPLVSRSYTDLLALQPGVISQGSGMNGASAGSFLSATFAPPLVSGDLNAGAVSVNGQREAANGYILNGVTVVETGFSVAGAVPNLDSIAEFRILTNNADAEYGNYSGGQVIVVTKTGTNQWHGSAFEFLRNTDFDAANYFEQGKRGVYHQNQFGATFGGPIMKDKLFFFVDYQGNRRIQALPQTIVGAPSAATEGGNLSGIAGAGSFAKPGPVLGTTVPTTVAGMNWASLLTTQLGYTVNPAEPYYFRATDTNPMTMLPYGMPCTMNTQCVFPNATLSPTGFSPIAQKLLPFIQPATINIVNGTGTFSTNAGKINLHDNKTSGRLEGDSRWGHLSAYYYFDHFTRLDPYWPSPATLYPGFGVSSQGRTHVVSLGDTKTFSSAAVNEARVGFFRLDTPFNQPKSGTGTKLASLGFASGLNRAPGIFVGTPSVEGIPETDFNNFSIGVPSKPIRITQNSFQFLDNFSKIIGTHTLKFGGQYHYDLLEERLSNAANGLFVFGTSTGQASETGSDFVDFLLGTPSQFVQGLAFPSYQRGFYLGLYAQDSWRIKSNLTLNYGLRYDVSSPWREKNNEIQTIIPGVQSKVFPGSPKGWLFPGDPGVPQALGPTRWNNFAPRLGLAYTFGDHEGALGKIVGKSGSTVVRVAYGIYYTALEGASGFDEIGDAPFGDFTGQPEPVYASPFINRASGTTIPNFFPIAPPSPKFSATNPASCPPTQIPCPYDTVSDFLNAFGTIGSSPAFNTKNRLPYSENYELSIEREITSSDRVSVSYVGTQGHHLFLSLSANPGSPTICQQLNTMGATPACGPFGENNVYTLPGGAMVGSSRTPLNQLVTPNGVVFLPGAPPTPVIAFGNDSYFSTIGNSVYNSLQINWKHSSSRLQTLLAYTFGKALDLASGYGEQVNPFNAKLSRGLAAFDSTHNFVFSYNYTLPIDKLPGPKRLTNGWGISGITRFATGLPVTIVETDDQSLQGTGFGGPITLPADTPNLVGPLNITDPRKTGGQYFSPAAFASSAMGTEGNASRRFFHGPGINNWDFAVLKDTAITERVNVQFRAELFNIWNHAQFQMPNSGIMGFASFGQVTSALPPRIGQLSLKLNF
jgi:hypothetical protein